MRRHSSHKLSTTSLWVNPELVKVMEQVAQQLSTEGKPEAANFLHHWAGKLNHIFEQAVNIYSKNEQSQADLQ